MAVPEGQTNIDYWPKGPAKVCRPRNEASVKRLVVTTNATLTLLVIVYTNGIQWIYCLKGQ